jgi:hypothetical protein
MKKKRLDMAKIAKALKAEHRGAVRAKGGHFGAMGLIADVEARFRVPEGGGRATDPHWTERRLVALAPETLRRLTALAAKVRTHRGVQLAPMQLAALLLEKTAAQLSEKDATKLIDRKPRD